MPQLIVKETTVYTLEELRELFPDAYDTALQSVKEWSWDGWEPSFFTDDLIMWIEEDYPAFSLMRLSNRGKHPHYNLEWDMDQMWIQGKGHTSVQDFLIDHRLRNKYRLLWNALKRFDIHFDVESQFGCGSNNGFVHIWELVSEIEYYQDELGKERCKRIVSQVEALQTEIEDWMNQIHDKLRDVMRKEQDYHFTDEFAIDEADAQELKFTEEGKIFHG